VAGTVARVSGGNLGGTQADADSPPCTFVGGSRSSSWVDSDLPDNNSGWRSEWFYIVDLLSGLPRRSGHRPVKIFEWDLGLSSRDTEDLKEILELVRDLKNLG
jgi:hypothetical protein